MTPAEQESEIAAARVRVGAGQADKVECEGHWLVWRNTEGFVSERRYQAKAIAHAVSRVEAGRAQRINNPGYWTVFKEAGRVQVEIHVRPPAEESDDAFLTRIYRKHLRRDPDSLGLAAWGLHLAAGVRRPDIEACFINCAEAEKARPNG